MIEIPGSAFGQELRARAERACAAAQRSATGCARPPAARPAGCARPPPRSRRRRRRRMRRRRRWWAPAGRARREARARECVRTGAGLAPCVCKRPRAYALRQQGRCGAASVGKRLRACRPALPLTRTLAGTEPEACCRAARGMPHHARRAPGLFMYRPSAGFCVPPIGC
jgi:hypothetical protein